MTTVTTTTPIYASRTLWSGIATILCVVLRYAGLIPEGIEQTFIDEATTALAGLATLIFGARAAATRLTQPAA